MNGERKVNGIEERLERLRAAQVTSWSELCKTLGIGATMLHYLRSGARNPSPKLMRRIVELEIEAGIATPKEVLAVREAPAQYGPEKQLNKVELKHLVSELETILARLKSAMEDQS